MVMHLASLGAGKGAGSSTLVQDNFNTAPNGTALSAETPAHGPSPSDPFGGDEFQIQGGTAAGNSGNFPLDVYASLGQSDVTVSSFVSWSSGCDMTFILRYQDTSNYWTVSCNPADETLYLIETSGGSNTTRATANTGGGVTGLFAFSAQTSGTTLSASWNSGAATVSYSSSDLQAAQSFGIASSFNFGAGATSSDYFEGLTITHP
jgi:hypothetical protein